NAVYARFDPPRRADDFDPTIYQLPESMEATQPLPDFPLVEGRMPTLCVVHDELPKWSPKMNRYTSLGTSVDVPRFDWDAFRPKLAAALDRSARIEAAIDRKELPSDSPPDWKALAEEVRQSFPEASVFLLPGGSTRYFDMNRDSQHAFTVNLHEIRSGSE